MNKNLEEVLSENQSQNAEQYPKKETQYFQKYYQIESAQGKEGRQQQTTNPLSTQPQANNRQIQKTYHLRLPVVSKEDTEVQRTTTHHGKRSKILIEKVKQNNDRQIMHKKSSNILKLYDLQNEDEEGQEVLVIEAAQANDANHISTNLVQTKPADEKMDARKQEDEVGFNKPFLIKQAKETTQRDAQLFQKRSIAEIKELARPKLRYEEEAFQAKKQDLQLNAQRSRLLQIAKASQANMKKGLFFQQKNNDQDYIVLPQYNSRSELDTGLQITTSREQFSSREIFDSKNLFNQDSGSRRRLPALQPPSKLMKIHEKRLYEKEGPQQQSKVSQKHKNQRLLKNGKYALLNQDINDIQQFVRYHLPSNKTLESTIIRNKTCQKLSYLDYDLMTNEGKYLLSCKKMPFHFGSTYNISLMRNQFKQQSGYFIGKIQANFVGSIFNVYTPKAESNKQLELSATICYSPDFSCCKLSFREIEVYIKNYSYHFQQLSGSLWKGKNLKQLYLLKENRDLQKIKKFVNKTPVWRQYLQAFVLDFRGKSKIASVKNMIIVNADDQREQALLLAKKENNQFFLDISYPFSPLIGYAVAITGFDFKLASQ